MSVDYDSDEELEPFSQTTRYVNKRQYRNEAQKLQDSLSNNPPMSRLRPRNNV